MNTLSIASFIQVEDMLELSFRVSSQQHHIVHYATHIIDLDANSFTVSLPIQHSDWLGCLEENQEVKCVISKKKSIWSFRTQIIQVNTEGEYVMKLALPQDVSQVQRRQHIRVNHETDVQVDFMPEGLSLVQDGPKNLLLRSLNISPAGIKVLAPFQMLNESIARLTFNLGQLKHEEDFQKTFSVLAKVIYSFCPEDTPSTKPILIQKDLTHRKHIVAFRFLELTEAEEKALFDACLHIESHRKPKDYTSRLEIQSLI
jgi:c-di-GMP-binding flagellar brake protein YcgR